MTIGGDVAAVQQRIAQLDALSAGGQTFSHAVRAARPAAYRHGSAAPQGYDGLINDAARVSHVDAALVKAIVANESSFNPLATSQTGAQGLMQLEPSTAAALGVSDAYDPAQNIFGGTRYVRGLLERFHGNTELAVAAYNAGPGAVQKYGGVPPYPETRNYVRNVLQSFEEYKRQVP